MSFKTLTLLLAFSFLSAHHNSATGQDSLQRVEWTTSKFVGTPEPPLPYVAERIYEDVVLRRPTEMISLPGTDRWVVIQMNGKVFSFSKSISAEERDLQLAVDLKIDGPFQRAYAIGFHPKFPAEPYCFVAYSSEPKSEAGGRLSKFVVTDAEKLKIDRKSEQVLMNWSSIDHHGGSIRFGPEGYLYYGIGDGQRPDPPDPKGTGQDISDLQSSILRIDIDGTDPKGKLNYRIPDDNPFVNVAGARGEVWALGVRNPWKMAFHPTSHELWTGDVGWEMMEMVYRIDRGANYGWSVVEGSQLVKLNGVRHAVPITPPILEYDHTEGRSITGGYFWKSKRFPELDDAYIYGDFVSGKIWGLKHDGEKITWQKEIAKSQRQIVSFALDDDGEVLVVCFDGAIEKLVTNPAVAGSGANEKFPRLLSETGLFSSVMNQTPSPGVLPYSINAHHWSDHTTSEQWFGLLGESQMGIHKVGVYDFGKVKGHFDFPRGTVFAKTVSYRTDVDDPKSARRLETQVLHRLDLDWQAYNYVWNAEQTDAILQDNVAVYKDLVVKDPNAPDGIRKQKWLHASRSQCLNCHVWRAGSINGFRVNQLNRTHLGESINQLDKFENMELVNLKLPRPDPAVSPLDESAPLEDRARRYLDLNCAQCHMRGAGGSAKFVLQADMPLEETQLIDAETMQGNFGIAGAKAIAPGQPSKSVLLYRMSKSGPGQMPKFGPSLLDEKGAQLVHDWIVSLDPDANANDEAVKKVKSAFASDDNELSEKEIGELISSIETALLVSIRCGQLPADHPLRKTIIAAAMKSKSEVRDLFEHYLPEDQRTERLGPNIVAENLLAIQGNVDRGRSLFFKSNFTCQNCHQISGRGKMIGPDLSDIGIKRTPEHLLRSILEPSVEIEEAFQGLLVVTADGELFSGLEISSSELADPNQTGLIDLEGKRHIFEVDDIEEVRRLKKSIMPEGLLEEFTAEQAADLLAFLVSLKEAKE